MNTDEFEHFWYSLLTTNDDPLKQHLSQKEFGKKIWDASKEYILNEIKNLLDEKLKKKEETEKEIQRLIAGYLRQWEK